MSCEPDFTYRGFLIPARLPHRTMGDSGPKQRLYPFYGRMVSRVVIQTTNRNLNDNPFVYNSFIKLLHFDRTIYTVKSLYYKYHIHREKKSLLIFAYVFLVSSTVLIIRDGEGKVRRQGNSSMTMSNALRGIYLLTTALRGM